jgi:pimeloyl-ACP methyl ester carboxylesterase
MNVRTYGRAPFAVAVLHGGPGAPGYMAPVARELAASFGALEPLQTRDSLTGQIEELSEQLANHADLPATVIGHSWGAILSLFLAAEHKQLVKKLILVGSGVFDARMSAKIAARRRELLTREQLQRLDQIERALKDETLENRNKLFAEWGSVLSAADMYDPIEAKDETLEVQAELHQKVWSEYELLRDRPGELHRRFSTVEVPALVIHGQQDPHPLEGIRPFLESCLSDVRFEILPYCGHYPWLERQARRRFFELIRRELPPRNQ